MKMLHGDFQDSIQHKTIRVEYQVNHFFPGEMYSDPFFLMELV